MSDQVMVRDAVARLGLVKREGGEYDVVEYMPAHRELVTRRFVDGELGIETGERNVPEVFSRVIAYVSDEGSAREVYAALVAARYGRREAERAAEPVETPAIEGEPEPPAKGTKAAKA